MRGRPKGSKNKPKVPEAVVAPKAAPPPVKSTDKDFDQLQTVDNKRSR
jgi:hypothetical protein